MGFSERLGLGNRKAVVDDAPAWLRTIVFNRVIKRYVSVDRRDDVFGGAFSDPYSAAMSPIGIKKLVEVLAGMTQEAPPTYYTFDAMCLQALEEQIMGLPWYLFYELLELIGGALKHLDGEHGTANSQDFVVSLNSILATGGVQWILSSKFVFERVRDSEFIALERELDTTQADPVKLHLEKARGFLNRRPCDAANCIKESVSSVESALRIADPAASTLGDAIKKLRKAGSAPQMLLASIEKLYAFANSEAGVRHGGTTSEKVSLADAEFVYTTCLAIIKYAQTGRTS